MSTSVVIPACNSAAFIRETLASAFSQTRLPDEVIVVDDASADDTPAIVRELAAAAPVPLRLIELPKNTGGPATPMNVGIEAAAGDCVALLDHDDLMLPGKIAAQAAVLDRHPGVELVLSDCAILTADGVGHRREQWPWLDGDSPANGPAQTLFLVDPLTCQLELMKSNRFGVSCTNYFFRKSLWSRLSGFRTDAGVSADYDFLLRATDKPIAWLSDALFWKRQHGDNLWQPDADAELLAVKIRERRLREMESAYGDERCKELRGACADAAIEVALGMYLAGCLAEFERLRQPLRSLAEVPLVASLLKFDPCPRWLGPVDLWGDTIKVAVRGGPLRLALARAYRRRGWHCRHKGQFFRAAQAFAHAVALSPGNKYYWRWLAGSLLRRRAT